MSGIFISYASEDRGRARNLARALEQRGWEVWWDREIPLGKAFDEVIEEKLAFADCVLVLWSKASVESRWVRAEASAAAARGLLIPVLLEKDVAIPLQFRLLHAADLSDWEGEATHSEFQSLAAHVGRMLDTAVGDTADSTREDSTAGLATPSVSTDETTARRAGRTEVAGGKRNLNHALAFVLFPTVLIGVLAVLLMNWRIATQVQLDLAVDRMSFKIGGQQVAEIPLQPLKFRSLSIENFDRVRFIPERFALSAGNGSAASVHSGAGNEFTLKGIAGRTPVMTIAGAGPETGAAGQMEQIALRPNSELILEARNEAEAGLTLRVFKLDLNLNLLPFSAGRGDVAAALPLNLSARDATLDGIAGATATLDPDLRNLTLAPYSPYITVEGAREEFVITAMLDRADNVELGAKVPVDEVEFLKQDSSGQSRTALLGPGQLAYPDYPEIAAVVLDSDDRIEVGKLRDAQLSRLNLDPKQGALNLRFEGEAGTLLVNSKTDFRLSVLDSLWHGPRTAVLFTILAWAFSVSVGAYKLYRDMHKA